MPIEPDILDPNLADNGSPTQAHALVRGSPAIDTASPISVHPPAQINAMIEDPRMVIAMEVRCATPIL